MLKSGKSASWNFGKISRVRAEQSLASERLGTFLVRESEHFPGDLTLSIKDESRTQHYRIKFDTATRSYTIDDESFFTDLHSLVQHYEDDADGLCCRLEQALSEKRDSPDSAAPTPSIDYRELHIGKMVGSGEFAGRGDPLCP